jgi:hypothetical protein
MTDDLEKEVELTIVTLRCTADFLEHFENPNTARHCRERADKLEDALK